MPKLDTAILKADGEYVSGGTLSKQFEISRVSIWSRLEKLRQYGFEFDAVRNRGYRLIRMPEQLHAPLVTAHLQTLGSDCQVRCFPSLDSTNSQAERYLADNESTPLVVLAQRQDNGRGRLGNEWYSEDTGNLYMSFAYRPKVTPDRLQTVTLQIGLALCEVLRELSHADVKIKWPNDLLVNQRKIAGILTEARVDTDQIRDLVVGIGLNINGNVEQWPDHLHEVAGVLNQFSRDELNVNIVAAHVIHAVNSTYNAVLDKQADQQLPERWKHYDALAGRNITVKRGKDLLEGIAQGIDEQGSLRLKLNDGAELTLRAGEVTLNTRRTIQRMN